MTFAGFVSTGVKYMKKKVPNIKSKIEIQNPELLRGALESMGFLVERSSNGNKSGNGTGDHQFDLKIEDHKGHKIRGINLRKRLESR